MWKFELELPAKLSTNLIYAGRHWRKRQEDADLFHLSIFYQHKEKHIFDKIIGKLKFPVDMEYVFYLKGKPLDSTNLSYMTKLCEDALKSIFLPEDDVRYVSSTKMSSMELKQGYKCDIVEIIVKEKE